MPPDSKLVWHASRHVSTRSFLQWNGLESTDVGNRDPRPCIEASFIGSRHCHSFTEAVCLLELSTCSLHTMGWRPYPTEQREPVHYPWEYRLAIGQGPSLLPCPVQVVVGQLEMAGGTSVPEGGEQRVAALSARAFALQIATTLLHTADMDLAAERQSTARLLTALFGPREPPSVRTTGVVERAMREKLTCRVDHIHDKDFEPSDFAEIVVTTRESEVTFQPPWPVGDHSPRQRYRRWDLSSGPTKRESSRRPVN